MARACKWATGSEYPILLRTEADAGHGIGTALSTRIQESTDIYSFWSTSWELPARLAVRARTSEARSSSRRCIDHGSL